MWIKGPELEPLPVSIVTRCCYGLDAPRAAIAIMSSVEA